MKEWFFKSFVAFLVGSVAATVLALEPLAPAIAPIRATNIVTLKESVDQDVTVHGQISRTGKSARSGTNFLNFDGTAFTVVCLGRDLKNFTSGEPADVFKGKYVEVTGKIDLYKGNPQIRLTAPSQIKVVDPPGANSKVKPIRLRKIARDTWVSPAGLRYQGHDANGLTRVKHVLRHARDIPRREGPHGVFDGGHELIFAMIDEAWKQALKSRIEPENERNRSAYLIPMGRRIGYLGGQLGASRGNPGLSRVFLVVDSETHNVITAFPK